MADIKWIKITTDIFDDEKIKIIDSMPARDEILVIWFKLLALTGKTNQNGLLFLGNKVAYTPEMLSAIFNRELSTVKLSLNTFETFGMIEISDNEVIAITNWEKHQNIDGMDKIREQNRLRQQNYREKQKLLECNATNNVMSQENNGTDKDKEEDKDKIRIKKKTKAQLFNESVENLLEDLNIFEPVSTSIFEFIENRKAINKPMTALSVKKFLNKLLGMSSDPKIQIKMIDEAIANGWQTVYPLKQDNKARTGNDSFADYL